MNICVIGVGYVGLVAGTCFAEYGNEVICVDVDDEKIKKLKQGIVPFYEPGLEELLHRNVKENRLFFTSNLKDGVENSSIIFIAVGTPEHEDGSADLQYVLAVAKQIAHAMNGFKIIVNKSTVPVGTAEKVKEVLNNEGAHNFEVVSNPEFLKEGAAIEDFMRPERVVIGCESNKVREIMRDLYSDFMKRKNRITFMDNRSAELSKYACNAFLATKISFVNEIANLCEKLNTNYAHIREVMGSDSRIGNQFLYAGVGYGGSCFPKDVRALLKTSVENDHPLQILDIVDKINDSQKLILFNKIYTYFNGNLKDKLIGIWGLAFKPGTDDMREAPSIVIIKKLLEEGAKIKVFDPEALKVAKSIFENKIEYVTSIYQAVQGVDALALITEWREFRHPDFNKIKNTMKQAVIFDGRNQYNPLKMKELGFTYFGIGFQPL
ncbi:MAG: UDP-glucose/GDP-mannose dehydrogenase family protein [Spirochaetota bacterium]|nr:UDP-glucose/GDP-mannose dehydrogenase family protein [Spirochaetota bacterium]